MDNTREKLIEFLKSGGVRNFPFNAALADHLIANGVTVEKPLAEYIHHVDSYAGLKGKYLVFKADTGEQVANCFVLRPDKDTAAVEALRAYAIATDNKTLSNDIHNWVGEGVTAQKWIPVTERLPDGECLAISMKVGHRYKEQFIGWLYFDEITDEYICETDGVCLCGVTHWMPLPEPPKEE